MHSLRGVILLAVVAVIAPWAWRECSAAMTGGSNLREAAAGPCLPDRQEFWGTDTKHSYKSYFALDFVQKKSGIKRHGVGKVVKDWSITPALRYDINPAFCNVSIINAERDLPQCVPATAVKEGSAWAFKNIDGATLFYDDSNPSKVVMKKSPDGTVTDVFSDWNNTISDDHVFKIPMRCVH